jgi:multidrug resistance protein, MATE family
MFNSLQKFLNCLQKNNVPLIALLIGQVLHVFWSWVFVIKLQYGIVGTGIASIISNGTIFLICAVYASMLEDIKESIFWPDYRSFQGLTEYLKIGVPQTLMLCSEWWAFELITLITGYLGVKTQAAQILLFNFTMVMFCFAMGLSTVSSTLIGCQIGK